ncbi:MAG: BON domain-containing protein [Planctomycetota bacterium]
MAAEIQMAKTAEEVKTDVVNEMRADSRVDASRVMVSVDEGVVTLRGSVPTYGARTAAELDAWSIIGVVRVDDQLIVEMPAYPPAPHDETLLDNARKSLEWNSDVDSTNVTVDVDAGAVTLTGTVPSHWEKGRAEELVGQLRGVIAVDNQLAVVPTERLSDEAIAQEVVDALDRNAAVNLPDVDVSVSDGYVTLGGRVGSGAERDAATWIAGRIAGVVSVENELAINP